MGPPLGCPGCRWPNALFAHDADCARSIPEGRRKRAEVILRMGRQHLLIGGLVVATEGDLCRSPDLPRKWSPEMLRRVAELVNE